MTRKELENNSFLENYQLYTQWQESPIDFHHWSACTIIGAITRRRVLYDEVYFQTYPNLYTSLVAQSAICKKSTCVSLALSIFREATRDIFEYEETIVQGKITPKGLIKKICFRPGDDASKDAIAFICIDEMGVFFGADSVQLGISDLITELYMCPETHDHITAEAGSFKVERAFVSILCAAVPSYLTDIAVHGNIMQQGLVGRFTFTRREKPKRRVADISRIVDFTYATLLKEVLVEQLRYIGEKVGKFKMTDQAHDTFEKWYEVFMEEEEQKQNSGSSLITGFIGRKSTHARKMAMIIALQENPRSMSELVIENKHIILGIENARSAELSLRHIFEAMPTADIFDAQSQIEQYIKKYKRVSELHLFQKFGPKIQPDLINASILALRRVHVVLEASQQDGTCWYYIPQEYRELDPQDAYDLYIKKDFADTIRRSKI